MLKGYRTLIFNALVVLAGVVAYLATIDLGVILPAGWAPWATVVVGVANIVLRAVTTTPLGQK